MLGGEVLQEADKGSKNYNKFLWFTNKYLKYINIKYKYKYKYLNIGKLSNIRKEKKCLAPAAAATANPSRSGNPHGFWNGVEWRPMGEDYYL